MALSIEVNTLADALEMSVAGEVDVSCASELRDAIDAVLAREDVTAVSVDLAQVPYIDSTGIGVLVGAVQRAAEAGVTLTVGNPQRNVRRTLDLLGISGELGLAAPQA